ncbi:MAG: hypothetical protein WCJ28_00365 [Actinomycetota bacterium]
MSFWRRPQLVAVMPDGSIAIKLSTPVRELLKNLVDEHLGEEESGNGAAKLFGPINPGIEFDDPLVLLHRETEISGVIEVFIATLFAPSISIEEGEAWLAVSQLLRTALIAAAGIAYGLPHSETPRPDDDGLIDALGLLQSELLDALGESDL